MGSFGKKNKKQIPSFNIFKAIGRYFDTRIEQYSTGDYSKLVWFFSKEN